MNDSIYHSIEMLVKSDDSTSESQRNQILKACRVNVVKRELISADEVCRLLDISKVTMRKYIARGLIEPIRYSARKIRYDSAQIISFAVSGIPSRNKP